MGASQSSFRPPGIVLPGSYLGELGNEIQYEKSMGSSRFLKSIKARHREGALVVKVFVKPDAHMDLRPTSKRIIAERVALADCPNLLPYAQALATERAGYLIRQWVASSLYDRISTRPFLSLIEKKWIAFQLLTGLKDLHSRKISHGDIKSENVLVTSWNWVYLSDFASAFKPTYLPEDDPSDFSYFFDTSGRRTCYLAPERFYTADSDIGRKKAGLEFGRSLGRVTEAMDVFGLGCVIGEVFVEGTPPFTLSQLFKYRSGEYSLDGYLAQIEDEAIRGLVKSMTSLNPADRLSCERYLSDAYGRVFPASFYDFLHGFIASTNELSSTRPPPTAQSSGSASGGSVTGTSTPVQGQSPHQPSQDRLVQPSLASNADEIINRVWTDFEQIQKHLTGQSLDGNPLEEHSHEALVATNSLYPLHLHLMSAQIKADETKAPAEDGPALLIFSLICANIRNCIRPTSIIRALDMLLAISRHLTDETKLDRMLPFIVILLNNDTATVRAAALRTLTQALSLIETITPANASVFTEYILPNVLPFASDPDDSVRCLYAQSLSTLAESGQRYLDMTQAMKADGTFKLTRAHDFDGSPYELSYDSSLIDLQTQIQDQINTLLTDPSASVRRALVCNITPLCVFLGRSRTADVFGLMTTHLNDRDWLLRSAFFESTVGISTCIGSKSVDEYIVPLMTEALADNEETVIARELNSLSTLAELGLYQKNRLWDTLAVVIPLLCHPNMWIRSSAAGFIASGAKLLPSTDVWCSLYPALRKMLQADVSVISEISILEASVRHLSKPVYEAAVAWATKSAKSPFWQKRKAKDDHVPLAKLLNDSMKLPLLSEEDKGEMSRLQMLGMSEKDSFKLLSLRDYISSVAAVRRNTALMAATETDTVYMSTDNDIALASLGVVPQNIIFSTGDTLNPSSEALQIDNWPRRFSLNESARSSSSSDLNRSNGKRSASGSSTADALRRRLVQGSTSTSSLISHGGSPSSRRTSMNTSRPPFPPSPSSVISTAESVSSDSSHPANRLPDDLGASSATIKPSDSIVNGSALSRQRSRVNMHGVEISKVHAAIGSDLTTALGQLTTESQADNASISAYSGAGDGHHNGNTQDATERFTTTYEGDDPSIKQLLSRVYLDNYREPMPEFGPFVAAKVPRKRSLRSGAREKAHRRPEGNLVGHLVEHSAAITSIAVAPDHLFFATGSEDGTVRIWDTIRLEKNVTSRSRQIIQQGGSIIALAILENSHCIASASSNGTLWVSREDVQVQPGSMPKYGKQATVRKHTVDSLTGDFITCMLHYDTDSVSKLIYATSQSKIMVMDIRNLRTLQTFDNPRQFGPISCLCIDRKHTWLVIGTLSGNLSLWDLRFGLLLRTWKAGEANNEDAAIHSCHVHKTRGKGRWIVVTLEGSEGFETWDIESGQRVEVYRAIEAATASSSSRRNRTTSAATVASTRSAEADRSPVKEVELSPPLAIEQLLAKEKPSIAPAEIQEEAEEEGETAAALHGYRHRSSGSAIRTLLVGNDYANSHDGAVLAIGSLPPLSELGSMAGEAPSSSNSGETGWIITGGEDRKLRFWDLGSIDKSSIVCGMEEGEEKASYSVSKSGRLTTYTEARPPRKGGSTGPNKRQALITNNQQVLLKAHQDAITALALLDLPFRCIVSGDRSGVIKIWE